MPLLIAALLAVAALVTPDTSAAVQPAAWHQEDAEPGARVADLDGRLRLQRASGEAFELGDGPRARQTEIREGDRLSTGWNSRLVIDIGPNRVKLDERSELLVRRLDRNAVALDLERGGVVLELRRDEGAWRWQVDSAAGRHQPHGAGLFRVDAPDRRGLDAGSATAWRSALRIENEDGTLLLPPGHRAERDRSGRWQIGFPQADAFAAWAMAPPAAHDRPDDWDDRRPRQWRAAPAWDVPPPTAAAPATCDRGASPHRGRTTAPPLAPAPGATRACTSTALGGTRPPTLPLPPPDIAVRPPRPDRRHHEGTPSAPPVPPGIADPLQPRPDEPRRPQRVL